VSEDMLIHKIRTRMRPKGEEGIITSFEGGKEKRDNNIGFVSITEQKKMIGVGGRNPNVPRRRIGKNNKSKPTERF
jgi:hypothetical protein